MTASAFHIGSSSHTRLCPCPPSNPPSHIARVGFRFRQAGARKVALADLPNGILPRCGETCVLVVVIKEHPIAHLNRPVRPQPSHLAEGSPRSVARPT